MAPGALADSVVPGATDAVARQLTVVDCSDVCFSIDLAAFNDDHHAPTTFNDLIEPACVDHVSVPNQTTPSHGLALLLATYGTYCGDNPIVLSYTPLPHRPR